MNREIKFKFYYRNPLSGKYSHLFENKACGGVNAFFKGTPSTIKCQFTGVNDGNGNPIFEGDIIRWLMANNPNTEITAEVRWGDCSWILYDLKYKDCIGYLTCGIKTYEIIGNIFENPELIK